MCPATSPGAKFCASRGYGILPPTCDPSVYSLTLAAFDSTRVGSPGGF
jgi:hypothetical protein